MLPPARPKRTSRGSIYESKSQDASPDVPLPPTCRGMVPKGRRGELSENASSEDDIALAFQEPCSFSPSISLTPSQQHPLGECAERQLRSKERPSIHPFHESHYGLLTLAATVAMQSADSQIAGALLEGILSTLVAVAATIEDGRVKDTDEAGHLVCQDVQAAGDVPLYTCYPELKALREINNVRKALYSLQTCPPHARVTFYYLLEYHIRGLYEVIPDPLFEAFFAVLSCTLKHHTSFITKSRMRLFEVQLLKTVEAVQTEILKRTKMLTERATIITLRFRHTIPYAS
ncbi:unnamed protein product [Phytomonas sp. EM1]|nr:unnamed protein product [Phytomonas sp. EM1]|eukprot:CCW61551.1 unnamed protein product [Phytomonas sp. isolate EM1]